MPEPAMSEQAVSEPSEQVALEKTMSEPAEQVTPEGKTMSEPAEQMAPEKTMSEPTEQVTPEKTMSEPAEQVTPEKTMSEPAEQMTSEKIISDPGEQMTSEKVVSEHESDPVTTDPAPEPPQTEPPPGELMSEPAGPRMADVERLARSVVSDTLQRAAEDAKVQRRLDHSTRDPETDDDGWLDVVGGGKLKKKVLVAGSGDRDARPKRGQVVTVSVEARLADGRPAPAVPDRLTFGLGDGEVITGLDLTVGLMQPGEKAEIVMESRFGYGEQGLDGTGGDGQGGGIPPDTGLSLTVTLEDIQPEPKYEEMTADDRLKVGSQKRDRGNWWFKRGDFSHAIQCYRRALDFFDSESDDFTGLPDDVHLLIEERLKVHNNLAAAQMKLEAYEAALRSLQVVLTCQPHNVKALYRKAKILAAQNKLDEACDALRLALQHSPDNRTVQSEYTRLQARLRQIGEDQKSLYRKMLGLPADTKPKRADAQKWSVPVRLLVCGVACALAAVAVSRMKLL